MRILFDTNVILDALLYRQPFAIAASRLLQHVEQGRLDGILCATSAPTIYYLASRAVGEAQARSFIPVLLHTFEIAPVGRALLTDALTPEFPDYEDSVIHEAAKRMYADGIVTRNQRDFRNADVRIYTPDELISALTPQE